ncbi:MAG: Ribosome maturation factor RimP [Firmicutes bacterium ADurb.Bin193]|nr:MAG: Ribosome maturation factor RimP [Firmicutes bacterium ADurb.Bin193]
MQYSKTEKYAFNVAEPIARASGCGVYDVEYVKEGPRWFLRIYIEKEGGVSLDDCEGVSRKVSDTLDRDNFIRDNYCLEVSSPGIERALRWDAHFDGALGQKIFVRQKNGETHEGVLLSHDSASITIDGGVSIPKQDIKRANIVFDFDTI